MKRKLLVFLALVTAGTTSAQIPAGGLSLGGCIGYESGTIEQQAPASDIKTSGLALAVNAIYMFNSNWGAGITTGYESEKQDLGLTEDRISEFQIGLLAKYQYGIVDRAACYLMPSVKIGSGKQEEEVFIPFTNQITTITDKYSSLSIGVRPGIHYQVKPRWHFDLGLGMLEYESITWKPDSDRNIEDYKENSFKFKFDTKSVRAGLTYVFGGTTPP